SAYRWSVGCFESSSMFIEALPPAAPVLPAAPFASTPGRCLQGRANGVVPQVAQVRLRLLRWSVRALQWLGLGARVLVLREAEAFGWPRPIPSPHFLRSSA